MSSKRVKTVKVNASKKVPVPGQKYSTQIFGATLEIEAPAEEGTEIMGYIRRLLDGLEDEINRKIEGASASRRSAEPGEDASKLIAESPLIGRSGREDEEASSDWTCDPSTEAQHDYIEGLCKQNGLQLAEQLAQYGATSLTDLTKEEAGSLINSLLEHPDA